MLDDFVLSQITEDVTSYYCVTCFYFNNTPVLHLALSNMLPFVSAMLPFMSAMLPFMSVMVPFMCAMLPF